MLLRYIILEEKANNSTLRLQKSSLKYEKILSLVQLDGINQIQPW